MTIDQRTPAQYCDDVIRAYTAAIHAALTGSDDVEPFARIVSPHIRNLAHMAKLRCVMRAAQINQRFAERALSHFAESALTDGIAEQARQVMLSR